MDSTQGSDLEPIFGDWSQSEKLSEIKPPLANSFARTGHSLNIYHISFQVHYQKIIHCDLNPSN